VALEKGEEVVVNAVIGWIQELRLSTHRALVIAGSLRSFRETAPAARKKRLMSAQTMTDVISSKSAKAWRTRNGEHMKARQASGGRPSRSGTGSRPARKEPEPFGKLFANHLRKLAIGRNLMA
jgi:hypothetical protein